MIPKNKLFQDVIHQQYDALTAKGRRLADFVLSSPEKAVFMTTRQLGAAAGASEASVVRFVRHLGFDSYNRFIGTLRDLIDRELTLMEREELSLPVSGNELDRFIQQDIRDIRSMQKALDPDQMARVRDCLAASAAVYIMGTRLSYSAAHYMGWTLSKIREQVFVLNGSDRTALDVLVTAPPGSAVVVIATSRYPNELIRLGRMARRYGLIQILIADSHACPLAPFSDHVLIAPQKTIPVLGNPVAIISLIHYLLQTLRSRMGDSVTLHQEKLEQAYLENDIWFN